MCVRLCACVCACAPVSPTGISSLDLLLQAPPNSRVPEGCACVCVRLCACVRVRAGTSVNQTRIFLDATLLAQPRLHVVPAPGK